MPSPLSNQDASSPQPAGTLVLSEACFAYPGAEPLLHNINLSLQAGERVHISGENGRGKSTLLALLVGLEQWQQGSMDVNGRAITSQRDYPWLRRQIGLLSQEPRDHLFCPTLGDDCRFGPRNHGASSSEAEQRCSWWLSRLGLSAWVDRPPSHLSAGQAQLAALAAVACCQPSILLLDEPSSALDQQHCQLLIELLRDGPWTICFTSHDTALVETVATRRLRLGPNGLQDVTV